MSAISDHAAKTQAFFTTISDGITGIKADVDGLKAKIEELQNSPGTITPADQALLDELETMASGLAARVTALDAETP